MSTLSPGEMDPEVFDIKNGLTKKCVEIPTTEEMLIETIRNIEALIHRLKMGILWNDEELSKKGLMDTSIKWHMRRSKMLEHDDPLYKCSFEEIKGWYQYLTNELADILSEDSPKKMPADGISIYNFSFENEKLIQKYKKLIFELILKYEVLKVEFRYAIAFLIIAFLIIYFR